ncbi:MAG: AI-2E family transporter [Deltaproteobacteria bacterium]|nr:MAG: AI-2E family transporter [Deltaproteobacteria bacterium]
MYLVKAVIFLVGYIIIYFLVENVLKPKLMGKEFNIFILMIFISLLFWSWVLGATGVILAIPLTIMIKKSLEVISHKRAEKLS